MSTSGAQATDSMPPALELTTGKPYFDKFTAKEPLLPEAAAVDARKKANSCGSCESDCCSGLSVLVLGGSSAPSLYGARCTPKGLRNCILTSAWMDICMLTGHLSENIAMYM